MSVRVSRIRRRYGRYLRRSLPIYTCRDCGRPLCRGSRTIGLCHLCSLLLSSSQTYRLNRK